MARTLEKFLSGKLGNVISDGTSIAGIIQNWSVNITGDVVDTTTLSPNPNLQGRQQLTKINCSGNYSGLFKKASLPAVEVGKSVELKLVIDSANNVAGQTTAVDNVAGYPAGTAAGTAIVVDTIVAPAEGTLLRFAGHSKIYTADTGCTTTSLVLKEALVAALTDAEVITISGSGSFIFGGFQFTSLNIDNNANDIVKLSGDFVADGMFFMDYEGDPDDYTDAANVAKAYGNANL